MKRLGLLLAGVLLATGLFGQATYFDPTKIGGSAEMIGRGNIEGFSARSYAMFDNPAGLYRVRKFSASLFDTTFMEEVNYRNYSGAIRLKRGVLGFGIMSAGVQGIPQTDVLLLNGGSLDTHVFDSFEGEDAANSLDTKFYQVGSFSYLNTVLKTSYQWSLSRRFHWGASLGLFSTKVDTVNANGMGLDIGMIYAGDINTISFSAKNLYSTDVTFSEASGTETLPLELTFGLKREYGDFDVFGQFKYHSDFSKYTRNLALTYHPRFLKGINLSLGYKEFPLARYKNEQYEEVVNNNITLGLGVVFSGVYFDYAYEQSEHIMFNGKHYFSFGFSF